MAPKKDEVVVKPLLGRPKNNLKIGVVGMPNVGKSSFFNSVTNSTVAAENYPFCTIDPSENKVAVPDERFEWLVNHYKPESRVPAYLTIIDIAGLVKGASTGAGLGNAFLSHIAAVDAIYHMVRAFENPEVVHVEDEVNPIRDMEIINEELRLKDEEYLVSTLAALEKEASRGNDKAKLADLEIHKKVHEWVVVQRKEVRRGDWNIKEIEYLNTLRLLTAKPMVYLVNLSQTDYLRKKNVWLPQIAKWVSTTGVPTDPILPLSVELELKISTMSADEKQKYLLSVSDDATKPAVSALPKIVVKGYEYLQLQYFFTCGADEVRAWTIRRGSKAPQAAGVIHTDFEKGFIMAEVMKYDDLREQGSEAAAKSAGKYNQKGREYIVEDGDIILFKFNVTTAGKKK